MTMNLFESMLKGMESIGIFQVVFPFILVLIIVYFGLSYVFKKWPKKYLSSVYFKAAVSIIIACLAALFFLSSNITSVAMTYFSIALLVIFLIIFLLFILFGFFGMKPPKTKK